MSTRDKALRDKAIRLAWKREQDLVKEGKGTRDWTPEQQKDILERGKVYDEDGKAFVGQHMKSAKAYPDYQGNPDNIQLLSEKEHLDAHDGNWQNPTNWYYDPVEETKTLFGEDELIPCEIICLSNPIVFPEIEIPNESRESVQNGTTETPHNKAPPTSKEPITDSCPLATPQSTESSSHLVEPIVEPKGESFIIKGFHRFMNAYRNFESEHPYVIMGAKAAAEIAVEYIAPIVVSSAFDGIASKANKSHPKTVGTIKTTKTVASNPIRSAPINNKASDIIAEVADNIKKGTHASPVEHNGLHDQDKVFCNLHMSSKAENMVRRRF